MVKIIFKTGVMAAGKSLDLLSNEFNFRTKGIKTFMVKPQLDTRSKGIKSRVGLERDADYILEPFNELDCIELIKDTLKEHGVVFFDEAQFIPKDFIKYLDREVRGLPGLIFMYGLDKDFNNNMFDTSKHIFEVADEVIYLPTTCQVDKCMKKATRNYLDAHTDDDSNVVIGDDKYLSVCAYHYNELMK